MASQRFLENVFWAVMEKLFVLILKVHDEVKLIQLHQT